ncbi:MAG TPA: hypothetical protein VJ810_23670 [Blastocatellia bacterium]|nr:hypothetical protein [Blastocatellia bacterium]
MRLIERTAFHEAGHAICYIAQGKRFAYATIKPGEGFLGHVKSAGRTPRNIQYDDSPRMRRWIEEQVICSAGGNVAERFFAKKRIVAGSCRDWFNIFDLLELHSSSVEEISAHHALLTIRTRDLLLKPFTWRMVEAVAEALLQKQTLKFDEARDIARQAVDALSKPSARGDVERLQRDIADYRRKFPTRFSDFIWEVGEAAKKGATNGHTNTRPGPERRAAAADRRPAITG